ncbi:MAG: DUF2892 domain-containing protein [Devosia sp.]|uniref:YgaP family membrane protein n=1 Tax=Devosia sp. TaxID=1871048 RepID=UPI001AD1ADCF|nr:DUF2892 domain-containing protein [Devosia sp.]MBN9317935.1 DUF2892 domain-containing protein [Devosia sp.]
MLTANVGTPDRIFRLIVGVLLIVLPIFGGAAFANPVLAVGLPVLGVVLVVTAFLAFCPIYAALGLSTRKREAR